VIKRALSPLRLVIVVGYGVIVALTQELTLPAAIAVLVPVLACFVVALRADRAATPRLPARAAAAWVALVAVAVAWELAVWTVGNNAAWPTLSMLLDPVLAQPWVRALVAAGWLAGGWWIATGSRAAERPVPP
jgi:hypothetical protein